MPTQANNKATSTTPVAPAGQLLPVEAALGVVHLNVTDGERATTFWTEVLGLTLLERGANEVSLGAGERELIVLHPGSTSPVQPRRTGLYHVAIHLPTRKELARAIARLFALRIPNSPTDHTYTEATYLSDPDGNGIELTFETPERGELVTISGKMLARLKDGTLRSGVEALHVEDVLAELDDEDDLMAPMPAGTRVGHVHLHVADLEREFAWYRDIIGFDPMLYMADVRMVDFGLETSRVPHALALNTWQGRGAPPPAPHTSGLRSWTIKVPTRADIDVITARLRHVHAAYEETESGIKVLDPSHNPLHIVSENS